MGLEITGEIIMDVEHETNREETAVTWADAVRLFHEE